MERGYRLRLPAVSAPLSIAAFGPAAIRAAARFGDRLVLNLVTPGAVARLRQQLAEAAHDDGRPCPRVAIWLAAAIPPEMLRAVALVGPRREITSRIADYRAAGADEICVVPATAGDDQGRRTLEALAPSSEQ